MLVFWRVPCPLFLADCFNRRWIFFTRSTHPGSYTNHILMLIVNIKWYTGLQYLPAVYPGGPSPDHRETGKGRTRSHPPFHACASDGFSTNPMAPCDFFHSHLAIIYSVMLYACTTRPAGWFCHAYHDYNFVVVMMMTLTLPSILQPISSSNGLCCTLSSSDLLIND